MKIFKCLPFLAAVLLGSSAIASDSTEAPKDVKNYLFYSAYENDSGMNGHPNIGIRYTYKNFVGDISFGYRYFPDMLCDAHMLSGSANVFYNIIENPLGNLYFGVGVKYNHYRINDYDWDDSTEFTDKLNFFYPTITLGHDFSLFGRRLAFGELFYRPSVITDNETRSFHNFGMKLGLGF